MHIIILEKCRSYIYTQLNTLDDLYKQLVHITQANNRRIYMSALIRIECTFDLDQNEIGASTWNTHLNETISIRISRSTYVGRFKSSRFGSV